MTGRHGKTTPSVPSGLSGLPGLRRPLPAATRSGHAGRSGARERLDARLAALAGRRTLLRRVAGAFAATAVVGATLSFTAAPGLAVGDPASAAAEPAFGGFNSTGTATPLKFEIYEPTIPLPAEPQLELSVGYSAVAADTSTTRSRASYLWPGAPVGEGFATIVDTFGAMLGLPPGLGKDGYPVQVNAQWPAGPESEADEPAPGMVQRATAGEEVARADNGLSTDGDTTGGGSGNGAGGDSPLPGLPTIPGLPGLSGLTDLTGLTGLTGSTGSARSGGESPASSARGSDRAAAAAPVLPGPLAALVDVGGFSSTTRTDNTATATVTSRAAATDISLLGGLATIEGVTTVSTATSNGRTGTPTGRASYGDIVVAGQRFRYGPDGFEAAGNATPVPGLPAQGAALLTQLGVTISTPQAVLTKAGDAATATTPGLMIELDLKKLRSRDGGLSDTLNDVLAQLPGELDQVKSPLQAAIYAAPRIVVYLGTSSASVDTSPVFEPPATDTPAETPAPSDTAAPDTGGGSSTDGAGGGTDTTAPPDSAPVDPTVPVGEQEAVEQAAITPVANNVPPGLPPLLSFPGLLLYGGLIGAGVAGFFVRRLGALALGASGSCAHGLTSGLPDLRKA